MSSDLLELEGRRHRRTWLASPAIATGLFFGAQIFLALTGDARDDVKAAAAEAPSAVPVAVRVVSQIRNLDDGSRATTHVPKTEAQLLELLDKKGCIVFSQHEVEKIGTQEASFDTGEVGVITADNKVRRATFKR